MRIIAIEEHYWDKEVAATFDPTDAMRGAPGIVERLYDHENREQALTLARGPINHYLRSLVEAASGWAGTSSTDYPGYAQLIAALEKETFDSILAAGGA